MKTEMEKCLAGEWYDCHDPFFMDLKSKAHHLLMKYNSLPMNKENQIILYQDNNDITRVSVRFADEDLWLT
jgi:hypothetical protein